MLAKLLFGLAASLSLVLLSACGGGGASGAAPAPLGAPSAEITFPPAGVLAEATQLTVTGVTEGGVTGVEVDGVVATTQDGYASWRAVVPLSTGVNRIQIDLIDASGARLTDAASVEIRAQRHFVSPWEVAKDPTSGEWLFCTQAEGRGLFALDAAGNTREISDTDPSKGPLLDSFMRDLAVDTTRNEALILDDDGLLAIHLGSGVRRRVADIDGSAIEIDTRGDRILVLGNRSLVWIDLETGAPTTVVSSSAGDYLTGAVDLALLPSSVSPKAYVLVDPNGADGRVMEVDLDTGAGTELSGAAHDGPALLDPSTIAWAAEERVAYVFDDERDALIRVKGSDGARSIVSSPVTGLGVVPTRATGMAYDPVSGDVVLAEPTIDAVVRIDPSSGDRTQMYEYTRGAGTPLRGPEDIVIDPTGTLAYVVDSTADRLYRVSLATGDRALVARLGSGPVGLDIDFTNSLAYVIDKSDDTLTRVDLRTGATATVSDEHIGSGDEWSLPHSVSLDLARGLAYVSDSSSQEAGGLWSVDLATGDRRKVSDDFVGTGLGFRNAEGMVYDPVTDVAYVADQGNEAVLVVDIRTGNRSVLTDQNGTGTGPIIETNHDIDLDRLGNRALVADDDGDAVFGVDLDTGARTILSGRGRGRGPALRAVEHVVTAPGGRGLIYVDIPLGGVVLVEPTSGDRVVLSR